MAIEYYPIWLKSQKPLALVFVALFSGNCFSLEKVSLQLRWDHQSQFAGYYAAKWQGYYEEVGLDVDIRSALSSPTDFTSAIDSVQEGRAEFGIGAADILIANERGPKLAVLASIFQKSAATYYARQETVLEGPHSLVGLKVARRVNDLIDIELQAMMRLADIPMSAIRTLSHEPGIEHLLDKTVDVIPGYSISFPAVAKARGFAFKALTPSDFGVDFYGDSLFTRVEFAQRSPELVSHFVAASLKGWRYALAHPQATAGHISEGYLRLEPIPDGFKDTFNSQQIGGVNALTLYPTVELGYIRAERWQKMHQTLLESGLVHQAFDASLLSQIPDDVDHQYMDIARKWGGLGLAIGLLSLLVFALWNFMLGARVRSATEDYRASEQRFRNAFQQSSLGIAHLEMDGRFIRFNRKFAELFGLNGRELPACPFNVATGIDLQADGEAYQAMLAEAEGALSTERLLRFSEDHSIWLNLRCTLVRDEVSGDSGYLVVMLEDITSRKNSEKAQQEMQAVIQQSQKLDALGKLTGGIAHDFNNTLGIMMGYLQLTREFSGSLSAEETNSYLRLAEEAGNQGKGLVEQLLMFSRGGKGLPEPVDLRLAVNECVTMIANSVPTEITITRPSGDGAVIQIDPIQLQQILMNLLLNARDSIEGAGAIGISLDIIRGGQVCSFKEKGRHCRATLISRGTTDRSAGCGDCQALRGSADWVFASIRDTGTGIASADQHRIFEPFYTTKQESQGTGMGLAVVLGLVEAAGGMILVDSELGKGTCIRLGFPVAMPRLRESISIETSDAQNNGISRPGTVLVVDDEAGMAQCIGQMFQLSGFSVLTDIDAKRALERFVEDPHSISLLMTDQRMPGMTGMQLATAVREIRPELPIIICSGFEGDLSLEALKALDIHFFRKPVEMETLLRKASELMVSSLAVAAGQSAMGRAIEPDQEK